MANVSGVKSISMTISRIAPSREHITALPRLQPKKWMEIKAAKTKLSMIWPIKEEAAAATR